MVTGRVVVAKEYRQPFVIEEYDVPDPEPGGLILKITQAGVCGSDMHTWRDDQDAVPLPPGGRVMGHEGTGVVFRLGDGLTTDSLGKPIREGDRLRYSAICPCMRCYQRLGGNMNWCPKFREPAASASTPPRWPRIWARTA
jgi:D-arabinose 1-dehydrogenase-like Zn-dependent alcohol dehydrogenase